MQPPALGLSQPDPGLTCTSARAFSGCGSHVGWGLSLRAAPSLLPAGGWGWSSMGVQLCQELLDAFLSALTLAQVG